MELITAKGMRMPKLGLGTWRMSGRDCQVAVERALALGYRQLDTAEMYGNEEAVGAGLASAAVLRSEIHLTTKVWYDHLAPGAMRDALRRSLDRLATPYVDLYLIHWPPPPGADHLPAALETLTALKEEGLARAIGVSNFPVALLRLAVEEVGAPVACNQVEYHALLDQSAVLDYARAHDMAVTAYSPLAQGRLAEEPALAAIARKHGATPSQIALAWLLEQPGVAAIPKAARAESQRANLEALSIPLDDEDRATIALLPKNERFVSPSWAPRWDVSRRAA
ncbi:MAG: aldo/keto reductase [Acetobacteraceae bacterium]|nr:aldo/keto reductase [Acetobacteraceae bacterium]